MNDFDSWILISLNGHAGKSYFIDKFVVFITNFSILKGGVFAMILWGIWFQKQNRDKVRSNTINVIVGSLVAIFAGRVLQVVLPHRLRPMHDPNAVFVLPSDMSGEVLTGWSSFPSDHAVLFFALAAGIYGLNRRLGIFCFFWALVVICLPRIYLGLHYSTDVIVGGVVGVTIMLIALKIPLPKSLKNAFVEWEANKPQYFYPAAFLVTWQLAVLGKGLRQIVNGIEVVFKMII